MRGLLILIFLGLSKSSSGTGSCVVRLNNTSYGVGLHNETFTGSPFCTYLGVRYAEAPVGPLRFRNPVLYHPSGPENYTTLGNVCPQEDDIYNFSEVIGDDDCLFMNIYAPKTSGSDQYPVLVFVHGGTFMVGSAQQDVANGVDLLIDSGVLVVSINYRLSVLGFLQYPAFNISGNFGLKDQRTALQWVQRYIKYFGGDPNRVTLMGQSAGAGSVTFHLYSEGSRGLFQQLFALGGSMLAPWALNTKSLDIGEQMVARYNISSIEELQELDLRDFVERNDFDSFGFFSMFYPGFLPAIEDGDDPDAFMTVAPHELILQKPVNQVPILVGHTSTEFELLLFYANFLYVGNNFPNNENESLLAKITRLTNYRNRLVGDPSFYKKLANVANLAYPIKRMLKHLSEHLEEDPIYFFKFEFDGRFGFYKNEFYSNRTRGSRYGAVHGDDLGYIFSPYIVQEALANRSEFRREWKVHERTVELVTNFVKYGNPTPKRSKLSQVLWPAFNSGNESMYLNIDDRFEIRVDRDSEDDYFQFWEPIYQCLYYYDCELLGPMITDMEQYKWIPDDIPYRIEAGVFVLNIEDGDNESKPILVDPIDFEGFITKNKTLIQNDPQRELLLYPNDDVAEVVLPKKFRTVISNIPSFAKALASSSQNGSSSGSGKSAAAQVESLCAATNGTSSQCASPSHDTNGSHRPAVNPTGHLLTRQALHTYESANHLIHYKYSAYGGTYQELPRISASDELKEELYEIDTDHDRLDEQMTRSQADTITKQGYLLKGPDTNSDRMFAHIGSKSFKRRYCYLRQEIDGTYILELHKDEKQVEAKTTIVMDFCTEVVPNPKKGRYCFELKMNAPQQKSFTLAADDEADMDDWLKKISSVIQQNKLQEDKRVASLERTSAPTPPPASPSTMMMYGTLKGLDQSMNPQLMKYGRETDMSIAQARKDNRRRLFGAYQQHGGSAKAAVSSKADPVEPYREQFGQRILLKCDSLKFRLQAPVEGTCPSPASNGEGEVALCQLEPYLSSVALYDAKNCRKLTENFYFDLNKDHVRDMLNASWEAEKPQCTSPKPTSKSHQNGNGTLRHSKTRCDTSDDLHPDVTKEWIARAKHAIFSVTSPNPDIFVVVKIDKILQGAINPSTEPYLKASKDVKLLCKLQKTVRQYAHKCGHYRMPFAWAARPLFRLYSNDLDTSFDFPAIYRQEGAKLKDDELLKLLAEYRKPDKFSKLTVIPGSLKIYIEALNEFPPNCLTTTLVPLKPFPSPPSVDATLEVTEFENRGSDQHLNPYATFVNHLYVYPLQLNYDSQKIFSRARNIAVLVELRDSDTTEARSIECIYGRPGQPMLVSQMSCPVLHHNTSPTWYEEIKLRLPLRITAQHHLLFSFFHVSCNIAKKKDLVSTVAETPVGYAWLPLLTKGKLNIEEQCLPVAASLPAGYLSIQPLGLGKGQNSGPEIQWIDNQRQIFTISFRLDSTVLTTDQHLHNLFLHAERLLDQPKTAALPAESESCKILKAAHAIQINSLITFLPTILNQLFTLLVATQSDEIGLNVIRLLVNTFHMISEEAKRKELLLSYVRYVFRIEAFPVNGCSPTSQQVSTVHGELCRHLPTLLHQNNTDFLLVNKFMKYSGIFFDIIIKSMGQFLLTTGRIKMQRSERFPKEFSTRIESLFSVLLPYLNSRHKDLPMETDTLNQSMSVFVKRCLTFMDRGFVFRLIRLYMDRWCPGDSRVLQEYKFAFIREICSHEHYIPLNLPFLLSPNNRPPDLLQQFCLSEDFCRQHFLAGMLLQEVKSSLNEISHIRRLGLTILKDLLAKHDLDDRYQNKGQLSRIALLYVPWLGIVLENLSRIPDGLDKKKHDSIGTNRMSCSSSYVFARESTPATVPQSVTSQTSTPKSRSNRVTMHFDCPSPIRSSLHLKDTSFLAAIAGQMSLSNGHSTTSLNSECSTLSQDGTVVIRNNSSEINGSSRPSHARSISVTQPTIIQRTDKFTPTETKDLLISFLFVVKHLSPDHMLAWWHNCTESETVQFFTVLDLSLLYFRYVGKKNIQVQHEAGKDTRATKSAKASTLPARMMPPSSESAGSFDSGTLNHPQTRENLVEETMRLHRALYESNLATEIGLIILDCMGLYSIQFRDSMLESSVLPKIARVYLRFLQLGQSESLSKHVFAALRAFINNFSQALFKGNAILCGQLVYELLKCCDSRLSSLRQEACAVLYLLMRSNFEFSGRKGLTRVHLQVIISVSQMIGNVIGLNNARFQESLSIINSYATSDKAMKGTGFPMEVKDLTRRVRTVLMATAQMQAHHMDPERLLELQHSLANSYASTPELRHTWLVTMARNHEQNGNISEAACCYLHIAALISEYLKLKGCCSVAFGAESFVKISRNIPRDEKGLKLDSGASDSQYTEQLLLDQLKECAECLDRAERHECLGELYRLIVPILEGRRDYPGLAQCYEHLMQSYNRVIEFNKSGKRLLGRFYRVIYYGQAYFEEENAVEYVYKEPKVTSLSEISERLHKQYRDKFGSDNVKMIMDSSPVDVSSLDPKMAYIQVTHVTPFFCKDELEIRQTEFEQNHDVDTFMYETPFTPNGGARGSVEDQWKRRTILTTQYSFPYVLKRVPVKERQTLELSPIEVAIDEMQAKVAELEEVVLGPIDLKKLQLRLQGSVAVTVNAGPLAYASAFLDPKQCFKYASDKVEDLKDIFREFIRICFTALQINANVISSDQREYHSALKENYENLCSALSDLLGEFIYPLDDSNNNAHRHSLALFSAISGAPNNSSTA